MKYNKFLAISMSAVLSLTLVGCSTTSSAKELKGEELNKIQKDDKEKNGLFRHKHHHHDQQFNQEFCE